MHSLHLLLLLITSVAALVLPQGNINNNLALRQDQTVPPPPATTPAPSPSIHCDNSYCDGSVSWCFYWGGMTAYDPTLGPVPGETRTSLGRCGAATATATATAL